MDKFKYYGSRNSGAPAWFFQRATGVLLVFVLCGHYILMHYQYDSGHTWSWVAARLANPWYKALDLAFVTIGMYHGVQGVWNVIRDFKLRASTTFILYGALVLLAVAFVGWGWITLMTFNPMKP